MPRGPIWIRGSQRHQSHVVACFGNEARQQVVVTAVLDNLGKGASGQAVQCLNLMLGFEEGTGL